MNSKARFHTNLDEAQPYVAKLAETWKGPMPTVGHEIVFEFVRWNQDHKRSEQFSFALIVCAVRWSETGEPTVELHAPRHFESIQAWMDYFRKHVKDRA